MKKIFILILFAIITAGLLLFFNLKGGRDTLSDSAYISKREYPGIAGQMIAVEKDEVNFLNDSGKVKKTIPLKDIKHDNGPYREIEGIWAIASENKRYVALISEQSRVLPGYTAASTDTIRYYNIKGDLLWKRDGIRIGSEPYISISSDGAKIFLVLSQKPENVTDLSYPNRPVMLDNDGNEIWNFGEYDDIQNRYITKNGRYGFFEFTNDKEWGVIFFDVNNKKSHKYGFGKSNEPGYCEISETGKATVSRVNDEIIDAKTIPFTVKTSKKVFYEYQF